MDQLVKLSLDQPHENKRFPIVAFVLRCADFFALLLALLVAIDPKYTPFSFTSIYTSEILPHRLSLTLAIIGYLASFSLFRLYRYAWRFASIDVLSGVIAANTLGVILLALLQRILDGITFPSR